MPRSEDVVVESSVREGPFRVRQVAYPPGHRQPPHAHPFASVTLVLSGSLRERASRREEVATPLSVVAKPPGVEHADEFGPDGARTLQISFEPAAVASREGKGCFPLAWRWLHGAAVARPLLEVWRALRSGESCSSEMIGERARSALGGVAEDGPAAADPPGWLREARRAVDDSLPRSVPVRRLAEDAGVHPVSLSRAFRRHYGCTITRYRKRERLRRAAACLRATNRDVSRIAFACGFADHSHLCRDFRGATGLTPTEFRRLLTGG